MSFARAQAIADAVLLEGYVLYPYRSSSAKNQYRWTFGVLAPRPWSEHGGSDPWWVEAQVLVEAHEPRCRARLRFLQVVDRRIETGDDDGRRPVERLEVDGRVHVAWEEGEIREVDIDVTASGETAFQIPAFARVETVRDGAGAIVGRIVRTGARLEGVVRVRVEPAGWDTPLTRIALRVENLTAHPPGGPRAAAMRAALASTHLLLASEREDFVSLIDPPPFAAAAAAACANVGTFPVLAGETGRRDLVLCSPIVLYDHPAIAPESPGDFCDASEIDELLALRTNALTPEEKALVRATDPRAAAILDRVEKMDPTALAALHGTIRDRGDGGRYVRGSRIVLHPRRSGRRTDAQDLLYEGCRATVEEVRHDIDGQELLAVTLDDDPAADLHRWKGRFHYYYPDEVEPAGDEVRS